MFFRGQLGLSPVFGLVSSDDEATVKVVNVLGEERFIKVSPLPAACLHKEGCERCRDSKINVMVFQQIEEGSGEYEVPVVRTVDKVLSGRWTLTVRLP